MSASKKSKYTTVAITTEEYVNVTNELVVLLRNKSSIVDHFRSKDSTSLKDFLEYLHEKGIESEEIPYLKRMYSRYGSPKSQIWFLGGQPILKIL